MAPTNEKNRRTEPVDASTISQESHLEKPTKGELEKSGYRLPESHFALEKAGGDLERANRILREDEDHPLYQDEVNRTADETQRKAMQAMGREYHVPGQPAGAKASSGPAENKAESRSDGKKK